jgi:hypothetical protein
MLTVPPKSQQGRPWDAYRSEGTEPGQNRLRHKLLQPGWGGHLDPDELSYIVEHLERDFDLRKWWGMRPSWRRIPEQAVLRIAMEGDPDDQALNRRLARPRQQSPAVA